ncbi:MAG: hypothetical protein CMJ46_08780 [Planctomyces sp.]|nr:hypothetical protein [Planctomyces sp.]
MDTDKHGFCDWLFNFAKGRLNITNRQEEPIKSFEDYVVKYLGRPASVSVVYSSKDFNSATTAKKIVFVASMWSGTSQLAIRTLGEFLRRHNVPELTMLVLNSDEDNFYEVVPPQLIPNVGYGLVLMRDTGSEWRFGTGRDLEHLKNALRQFVQE